MCAAVYAAFEAGSSAYDLYDLTSTALDYRAGKVSETELGVTAAGAAVGVFAFGGGIGKASREAIQAGLKGVTNVAEQVAFQSLLEGVGAGRGIVIAGAEKVAFRDAGKFAAAHGGTAADYVKRSTLSSVGTAGGKLNQIHWVENVKTRQIYDVKLTTNGIRTP